MNIAVLLMPNRPLMKWMVNVLKIPVSSFNTKKIETIVIEEDLQLPMFVITVVEKDIGLTNAKKVIGTTNVTDVAEVVT